VSQLCSVCNSYPCPGCLGAAYDRIGWLKKDAEQAYARGVADGRRKALEEVSGQLDELEEIWRSQKASSGQMAGLAAGIDVVQEAIRALARAE
jgi:hypothetical protein